MTLYEIDDALLKLADPETGEITDWEAFDQLQLDRNTKIENTALYIKNLKTEVNAIKVEMFNLSERMKVKERAIERATAYLDAALCGAKFETAKCKVSYRSSERLEVTDEAQLLQWAIVNDRDCIRYGKATPNVAEIKKRVKDGTEIPGAILVAGKSLNVK